jgi:hypothetical protein
MSYWRKMSRRVIQDVLNNYRAPLNEEQIREVKAKLSNAYPFGERKYYPYKIWLEEIKKTLPQLRGNFKSDRARERTDGIVIQPSLFDS